MKHAEGEERAGALGQAGGGLDDGHGVAHQGLVGLGSGVGILANLAGEHGEGVVVAAVRRLGQGLHAEVAASVALEVAGMHLLGDDAGALDGDQAAILGDGLDAALLLVADRGRAVLDDEAAAAAVEADVREDMRQEPAELALLE